MVSVRGPIRVRWEAWLEPLPPGVPGNYYGGGDTPEAALAALRSKLAGQEHYYRGLAELIEGLAAPASATEGKHDAA